MFVSQTLGLFFCEHYLGMSAKIIGYFSVECINSEGVPEFITSMMIDNKISVRNSHIQLEQVTYNMHIHLVHTQHYYYIQETHHTNTATHHAKA
jgi:hypothetical protein